MPAGTTFAIPGAPAWVTVNPDGSLNVQPPADVAPGAYLIPVEVTYADGTKDIVQVPVYVAPPTAVIDSQPPVITPIADQTYVAGTAINSLTITATDDSGVTPVVVVSGLPAGLSFDPVAYIIYGTPTTPGVSTVTVTAFDQAGNSTVATFTITVDPPKTADVTTPIYDTTTTVPAGGINAIPAPLMDDPRTPAIETAPLPVGSVVTKDPNQPDPAPWATINPDGSVTVSPDGTIAPGVYVLPLIVTYPDGSTDVTKVPVTVTAAAAPTDTTAPVISAVPNQTITLGQPITNVIPAVNEPATILVNRMPAGVTYDPATNTISGTPTVTGTFPVTITAIDAAGNTSTLTFDITINPAPVVDKTPPTVAPIADASGTVGTPIAPIVIVASDSGLPLDVKVTGLPAGLTYDPTTGEVIGTPTVAGTFPITVVVTDTSGNSTTVTFTITVAEAAKTAATTDPIYVGTKVPAGQTATVAAPTFTTPVTGATFAPGTGMPSWATVDPATGAITLAPGATVVPGMSALPVVVTYPDGSTDTVNVPVEILPANTTAVDYPPRVDVVPGTPSTVTPTIIGDTTGASFAIQNNNLPAGATATVDGSGVVTINVPEGTPGGRYTFEVVTKIPGQPDQIDVITVVVSAPAPVPAENTLFTPAYAAATATPGTPVVAPVVGMANAPAGTSYSIPADVMKILTDGGWTVTIDPATGQVTATAPANAADKTDITIPATVTYPDGSVDVATLDLTVNNPAVKPVAPTMDTIHQPGYVPATVEPGQTITVTQTLDPNLPAGTAFSLVGGVVPAGWTVTVDPATGALTVTPPAGVAVGTQIPVSVLVTYPDGSQEVVSTTITVGQSTNQPKALLTYPASVTATPGTPLDIPVTVTGNNGQIPAGTLIDVNATALPAGSTVAIDPTTGALKVTIPAGAVGGPFPVLVTTTVPGMPPVTETIMVALPAAPIAIPTYPATVTAEPGTPTDIVPQLNGQPGTFPAGTEVKVDASKFPGTITLQPNGTMTVTGTTPGTYDVPVTITVPGQPPITQTIKVTVGSGDAAKYNPSYTTGTVTPGQSVDVPQTGDPVPFGTSFTIDTSSLPTGWIATIDPVSGKVTFTAPADAAPGTVATAVVTIKYPDGTTDTTTVAVTVGQPALTDAASNTPAYTPAVITPGMPATITQTGDTTLPAGTKFSIDLSTLPTGWTASIDPLTGAVTVIAPADAKNGAEASMIVTITYPDGSVDHAVVTAQVNNPGTPTTPTDAATNNPGYQPGTVTPGNMTVVKQTGDITVPTGTKFEIDTTNLPVGWTATVDPITGDVTVIAPKDAKPGTSISIPVKITYPDGSVDAAVVEVTVPITSTTGTDAEANNPAYQPGTVAPGASTVVKQTGDTAIPAGTKFEIDTTSLPAGWTATVDPITGDVTVTAPKDAKPGTKVTIPVKITYPDGSVDVSVVTVTVGQPPAAGSSDDGIITVIIGSAVIGGLIAGAHGSSEGLTSSAVIGGAPAGSTLPGQPAPAPAPAPGQPVAAQPVAGQPAPAPAPAKLPSAPIKGQPVPSDKGAQAGTQAENKSLARTGVEMFQWVMMLGAMFLAIGAAILAFVKRGRRR